MTRTFICRLPVILMGLSLCRSGLAQSAAPVTLQVDIENWVLYLDDTADSSKFATVPEVTPAVRSKNFNTMIGIADIVAVNGEPVKGTMIRDTRYAMVNPNPAAGQAIGDVFLPAVATDYFEILKLDGTVIGTIMVTGIVGSPPAPGAPLAVVTGNFYVTGGTGAFLGVRGQSGNAAAVGSTTVRQASITEDPANRRNNGGGRVRWIMSLFPQTRPEIVMTPEGPAITHSNDFSLVSAAKPASGGETLSLFASNLGPTKPGVDAGTPFPSTPLAVVNSPVSVTVNGVTAEVLGAVGYPGSVDGYQVNFRLPPGTAPGTATVQVSAAWISSSPVKIATR